MERILEVLFKYRPSLYDQGELAFAAPRVLTVIALGALLLLIPVLWRYRRSAAAGAPRWALLGLRAAAIALIVFCLLQPSLVLSSVVPQQSFVGVLADDSLSMRVADAQRGPRSQLIGDALGADVESFGSRLAERFRVRLFGFSKGARRLSGAEELRFDGRETRLDRALAMTLDELQAVPLSGLVLFTDGAQTSQDGLADVLLELRSRDIPVYPVPLGRERFSHDIEISRVEAPHDTLLGSTLQVDLTLTQSGFSGRTVSLEVEDEGRIVAVEEVEFPTNGEPALVTTTFTANEAGPRRFRFRVAPETNETITANNERVVLIQVEDRTDKILYFEGEPRFEVKFLRRAVEPDENLQLVGMVRQADNHFYRFGLDSRDELADGFPTTREELFKYRGIILGSVEASFFTYDQMRMILDFVSERGGGLLLLGGRRAFAEGGFAGTPIAEVMPIELRSEDEGEPFFERFRVRPTSLGKSHPAIQLVPPGDDAEAFWSSLPELSSVNRASALKPGATALLVAEGLDETLPVLSYQRYGRGRAIAMLTQDSWLWQMVPPLEDQTHETYWRQMLRWLVSYVDEPVELAAETSRAQPGEPVTLITTVRDPGFQAVNGARVEAEVHAPSGAVDTVPFDWTITENGVFTGTMVPVEEGLYRVEVAARASGEELGTAELFVESTALDDELFGAQRRSELLERIAGETGGKVFESDALDALLDELTYSEGGATVREYRDLWDMPAIFLLLLILLGSEWAIRRWQGLT